MSKQKDREILELIMQPHPPVNPYLFEKWEDEAEHEDVKALVHQWQGVVNEQIPMIDMNLFERCQGLLQNIKMGGHIEPYQ